MIIILLGLSMVSAILRRVYSSSGGKNLFGEELEVKYQRAFTQLGNNKPAVNAWLWALTLTLASIGLLRLENYLNSWWAVLAFTAFLGFLFVYLGSYHPDRLSISLAKKFSGLVAKAIAPAKRYFGFLRGFKFPPVSSATAALYLPEDLIDLLKDQLKRPNNKIDEHLLRRLISLAKNRDQQIGDIMTPLNNVKKVDHNQEIGPVIIDELHRTGNKYFLVENTDEDELIGYVKLRDLTSLKKTGKIQSIMHKDLDYIEKKDELFELIDGFLAVSTPIFLVRDEGETVGVVTIDACLDALFKK